jgi:hypothetical protein
MLNVHPKSFQKPSRSIVQRKTFISAMGDTRDYFAIINSQIK